MRQYQIIDSHGAIIDNFGVTSANILSAIASASFVSFADGSVSAPSITFTTDTGTGFYHTGTGVTSAVLTAINGVNRLTVTATWIGLGTINPLAPFHLLTGGGGETGHRPVHPVASDEG